MGMCSLPLKGTQPRGVCKYYLLQPQPWCCVSSFPFGAVKGVPVLCSSDFGSVAWKTVEIPLSARALLSCDESLMSQWQCNCSQMAANLSRTGVQYQRSLNAF